MLVAEGEGHLINRGDVHTLHDRLSRDVAEESHLAQDVTAQGVLGTQYEDIGLDTHFLQLLDGVLGRLGLHLSSGSDIGHIGQVDAEAVLT